MLVMLILPSAIDEKNWVASCGVPSSLTNLEWTLDTFLADVPSSGTIIITEIATLADATLTWTLSKGTPAAMAKFCAIAASMVGV